MVWAIRGQEWELRLSAAQAFYAEHGHLNVPKDYRSPGREGFGLGAWPSKQRRLRRARQLGEEEIAALDALGMTWDPRGEAWEEGLAAAHR